MIIQRHPFRPHSLSAVLAINIRFTAVRCCTLLDAFDRLLTVIVIIIIIIIIINKGGSPPARTLVAQCAPLSLTEEKFPNELPKGLIVSRGGKRASESEFRRGFDILHTQRRATKTWSVDRADCELPPTVLLTDF